LRGDRRAGEEKRERGGEAAEESGEIRFCHTVGTSGITSGMITRNVNHRTLVPQDKGRS